MKKSFTLSKEITIALSIIIIFGFTLYRQVIGTANQKVCEMNMLGLEIAVEAYVLENNALPANLAQLKTRHLQKGYAKIFDKSGLAEKLAYIFVEFNNLSKAYAQSNHAFLTAENLSIQGAIPQILQCPAAASTEISYGINNSVAGRIWEEVPENTIIIADCHKHTFNNANELACRHIQKLGIEKIAQAVTKGKRIKLLKPDSSI